MKRLFIYMPLALMAVSCGDYADGPVGTGTGGNDITASIASSTSTASRTMVDTEGAEATQGVIGLLWTDGDRLGAFDAQGSGHTLYEKRGQGAQARAVFATTATGFTPRYAYYPYDAANDGRDAGSLTGAVPSTQTVDDGNIDGDYKYGRATDTADGGHYFEFAHMFSLVRADIDATGSDLEGETLKSIEVSVSRGDAPVGIAGGFTFSARNGSYTPGQDLSSSVTMKWSAPAALSGSMTVYASMFPTVRTGDALTFRITTDSHIATFTVNSKINFERESVYTMPLEVKRFATGEYGYALTDPEGNPVNPSTPSIPSTLTGTFTAATYNVDGLPNISNINPDGPQEDGTKLIAEAVNNSGWDFFGVSEDFEYHSTLLSGLTNFNAGTWRGTVTSAQLTSRADTDGLCLFWNNKVKAENETYVQFTHEYGGATGGANTCIKKGFRYYLVTLADGTEIDVYITHMNTYSSGNIFTPASNWLDAANGQLTEIADYIKSHQNGRPIIIMGDTNCRYTRHLVKTNLIDAINADSNLEIDDPWCSLAWGGDFSSVGGDTYPAYGGKSIMVSDATGTNSSTDVIISEADGGLQKGEVVDKVFYVNCKDARTQLKARSYLRDTSYKKSDGSALADHYPVVVEFEYTTTK